MRSTHLKRKTKETDISVTLNLDGTGLSTVCIEDQFLKHMLETFSKYSSFDLNITATGDNMHHLIEDVAITLGDAFKSALGETPVERVSFFILPMDDALVMASVDLVDRPWCDAYCPDDLYLHFFRSFAMSSGMTLHIMVYRGFDDHHIIEASFKALGKALKSAVVVRKDILSTKNKVIMESD